MLNALRSYSTSCTYCTHYNSLHSLHYSLLLQAGYPTRIPYEAIHSRYSRVFPPEIQTLPPSEFAEVLAGVCNVRPHSYFLGKHRIV